MANLFKNKIIRDRIEKFDIEDLENKLSTLRSWVIAEDTGELQKRTETQCEQAFNADIFVKVLDYTPFPQETYTIQPKDNVESGGGQLPDATLGYYNKNGKRVIAVVEIKDANTSLEKSQHREGNLSPIQQGFKYKPLYKDCGFVIITNFLEIRLFRDNQLDYEIFTLKELVSPKDDYFAFRKFYYLLCAQNFITEKGQTETEKLLSAIRIEQEKITKSFYQQYKQLREDLIKDITNNNKEIQKDNFYDLIVEKAQKLVDRIVLICFFEDSGLLPEGKLIEVVEYAQKGSLAEPIWETIKRFFQAVDAGSERLGVPDGYNGELFKKDEDLDTLKISDAICRQFVELSKYDFEEDLSVNILGHIFEQSITDLEKLKRFSDNENKIIDKKDTKRKKLGIYYTPEYIVDFIIKNSLGKYLSDKELDIFNEHKVDSKRIKTDATYDKRLLAAYIDYQKVLRKIKVLDPACGSGAFLVKVFDYLLAENKRVAGIIAQLSQKRQSLLDTEQYVRTLLHDNIFGVDLSPESVEITKLSLWLKSAKKGQKLITLKDNIKCGNSLIDDQSVAGHRAFDWNKEFVEIMRVGGFDVIVGNPPYVSYYSKQSQADLNTKGELDYFIKTYNFIKDKEALGRFNTIMFFFEKAIMLLKKRGFLGFIVDTNIHSNPYLDTRKYVCENITIHKIVDELKVFEGVSSSQLILVGQKENETKIVSWESLSEESSETIASAPQYTINESGTYSFKLPTSDLIKDLVGKIAQYPKLSALLGNQHVRTCITFTGRKDRFVSPSKKTVTDYPLLEGSSGVPYPYSVVKYHSFVRYDLELRDKLNKEYVEEATRDNKRSPKVIGLGNLKQFRAPKLFIRLSDKRITATYTDQILCADLSLYIITLANLKDENEDFFLKYILAVLNSKLTTFYAITNGYIRNLRTGTPQIRLKDLRQLPIPTISKEEQKKFILLVDELMVSIELSNNKVDKLEGLLKSEFNMVGFSRRSNKFYNMSFDEIVGFSKKELAVERKTELYDFFLTSTKDIQLEREKNNQLNNEIDSLVYKTFNLSSSEITIIDSFNKSI